MNFERDSSRSNSIDESVSSESSFVGSFKEDSPIVQRRTHNPTVAAMLSSNMMKDCGQVMEMHNLCVDSGADSTICKTAKKYIVSCARK